MRVAIVDYGAGNLYSLKRGIDSAGVDSIVTADIDDALASDVLVLPGVGGFRDAAKFLSPSRDRIREALHEGLPCLGICLGMQLLFESSEEGEGLGLGAIRGRVRRLKAARVPQMGWNSLDNVTELTIRAASLNTAYFANSYVCDPRDASQVTAWATHEGDRFPAAVRSGKTVGVQFHPEKSSAPGIEFIEAFLRSVQ
jgi:glutamine amidotransferase